MEAEATAVSSDKKVKRPNVSIIVLSVCVFVFGILAVSLVIQAIYGSYLNSFDCVIVSNSRNVNGSYHLLSESYFSESFCDQSKIGDEFTFQIGSSKVFNGTYSHTYTSAVGAKHEYYYNCSDVISISDTYSPQVSVRSDGNIGYIGGFVIDTFDFSVVDKGNHSYELSGISEVELKALVSEYLADTFDLSYYDECVVGEPYDAFIESDIAMPFPEGLEFVRLRVLFRKNIKSSLDIISPEYIELIFTFDGKSGYDKAMLISITHQNIFDDPSTEVQERLSDRNINIPSEKTVNALVKKAVKEYTECDINYEIEYIKLNTLEGRPFLCIYVTYQGSMNNSSDYLFKDQVVLPKWVVIMLG